VIPGSGPGRGVPWWRGGILSLARYRGGRREFPGWPREGRTVARIRPPRS